MDEIKFAAEGVHPDARLRNEAEQGVHLHTFVANKQFCK